MKAAVQEGAVKEAVKEAEAVAAKEAAEGAEGVEGAYARATLTKALAIAMQRASGKRATRSCS